MLIRDMPLSILTRNRRLERGTTFSSSSHLSKRFKIITGLAEGLVYLHKGSMSCLVRRDLKPHNILLDYNMSLKITDFGSARTLSSDIAEGRMSRVVGTRYQLPTILIITYSHHLFSDVLISQS
jgi:serine/threonine protein kinase